MKKITLAFLIFFYLIVLPFPSHALIPVSFGGRDIFRLPTTCSIPPFVPSCNVTPILTDFLAFYFDFFAPLYVTGNVPIEGIFAIRIGEPLLFPNYALFPGEWAIGFEELVPPVGGFFLKAFIINAFPTPSGKTFCPPSPWIPIPPVQPVTCCLPSACYVYARSLGTVTPYTGAAPGGFGI